MPAPPAPAAVDHATQLQLLAQLDELRQSGVLSEPEFEGEEVGHPTRPLRRWPTVDTARGAPSTALFAACRVGDSPVSTLAPLMIYFPVIVTFAHCYQKNSGVGSRVTLMLPVAASVLVSWLIILIRWFMVGIPLGPGYPVRFYRSEVVQG